MNKPWSPPMFPQPQAPAAPVEIKLKDIHLRNDKRLEELIEEWVSFRDKNKEEIEVDKSNEVK
jgi:hypothetical protein